MVSRGVIAKPQEVAAVRGAALELANVEKRYGETTAVDDLTLDVAAGEFVTLLGPSGSGKTTVLKMIAGFENASSGDISIGGRSVTGLEPRQRNLGMVFQNYALFPHLTVAENVAFGLKFRKYTKNQINSRVEEMLSLVRMSEYRDRNPAALSGGQQQRVALARALAIEPALLLMDEPLGALDRELRLEMSAQIKELHRSSGTTFLYVTHDQEEALLLSDRVAIMKDSRLVSFDTAENLYSKPPDPFTASFFGNCNRIDSRLFVDEANEPISCPAREVFFHAEDASLCPDIVAEPGAYFLRGSVRESLFMGASYQVLIDLDEKSSINVRVSRDAFRSVPSVGDNAVVRIHKDDLSAYNES